MDRGRSWRGPHRLPSFGLAGVSARTDVVALGRHEARLRSELARGGHPGPVDRVRRHPPALVRTSGGTLLSVYGYRDQPCGLRYVASRDGGATWSDPVVLTADTPSHDMGYPRAVALGEDVLAVYYFNAGPESERFIEAVRWSPP